MWKLTLIFQICGSQKILSLQPSRYLSLLHNFSTGKGPEFTDCPGVTVSYPITSNTNLANITLNPVARIPETGEAIEFNVITGPDIEFPSEVTYDEIYLTGQKFVLRATDQFNREGTCSFTVRLTGELLYPFPSPPPKKKRLNGVKCINSISWLSAFYHVHCLLHMSLFMSVSMQSFDNPSTEPPFGERCSYWRSSIDCIAYRRYKPFLPSLTRWEMWHDFLEDDENQIRNLKNTLVQR